ncbi:site-specific DNA-methyltransferase [Trueperella sp. LYQ143]|uniref:site-specific DNA-methyltransferase n=1 Tax=Trueperella sp. LYQ143 TaxID=3391059 RepID=UPI003983D747
MPELQWIGKDKVINHHLDVPYHVLERKYAYCGGGENDPHIIPGSTDGHFSSADAALGNVDDRHAENKIIHGDNLLALKALLPQYEGKVDCIYIDPPYNTGNEGWVYNDNVNDPRIKKWLGEVVGKEGEDLTRHDKWLCMMYPRLRLLHRLLAPTGVIAVSIDDDEMPSMRMLLDEIFGRRNFYAQVVWQKKYSPANDAKRFSDMHDYIIFYAKSDAFERNLIPRSEVNNSIYKYDDQDGRGPYASDNLSVRTFSESGVYPITNPNTGEVFNPPAGRVWSFPQERMQELLADNRIFWGAKGTAGPRLKRYLSEIQQGVVPVTWWPHEFAGHNDGARKEIRALFGTVGSFDTPKPTLLLEKIFQICGNKNALILDSFAGSGTTAHAVLNLNKQDGGNRRFILCEMMDYADTITAERVKRVIDGYGEGNRAVEGTGGSFSYYELGEPLMIDTELNPDVPLERIREYIWFTDTGEVYRAESAKVYPYFLGHSSLGVAYFFVFDPHAPTVLNRDLLASVPTECAADSYVIYADTCVLSEQELLAHNITFKKIPRDITRL